MPRKMKNKAPVPSEEHPSKRTKLFDDDAASDDDAVNLTINEEFAKRFEYNKKREEKQRLEEKYGDEGSDDESSTDEDEDDAAELATADLDNEIFATLNAIKKKDPRVYDPNVTFYTPFEADQANSDTSKKEKPLYLADYHRQNLLNGNAQVDEEEDAPPQTYAQEQQALKDDLINQMHAAADDQEEGDDEDDFLVRKPGQTPAVKDAARPKITERDIQVADKDPETFLSNFMQSRAWVPDEKSRFDDAFDSDDSEDERRAEMFESAYNMRFEDPAKANEKLMTFSRDVAKLSARREEKSGRKKQREKEREKKEAEKRERTEDKARLRKLKIDEVEEKVKKIKEAAGLKNQALDLGEWKQVLDEDWDDDQWEQEMKRRFGDNYYADKDAIVEDGAEEEDEAESSKKPSKPKWDDDIDIGDLVPEFDEEAEAAKLKSELAGSDEEEEDDEAEENEDDNIIAPDGVKRKTKKDRLKEAADKRRVARKERMAIEELVDADLTADLPTSTKTAGFRYRETSPTSFGLTARDILFADDTALNEYAGLKKLATWRDDDKKKKDKKKLGKKARLRQWRKDTFGNEEGFTGGFKEFLGEEAPAQSNVDSQGGSRKRRGKKRKAEA
ncbi:Krr1-domain-containing protein [Aureobasidium subglaciale]|nr:Krr1-domain-containing protein [Aureobasidium subglaciale]